VAVLTDRGVGSAAEALVLQLRQSPRVIVVGENTKGNIDYPSVYLSSVGCGDQAYQLGVPLYAGSRDLPVGGFDGSGIAPDVPVADSLTDPLAFAVRLLRR
jgi:C-terminal processing protease CtpA/Prc